MSEIQLFQLGLIAFAASLVVSMLIVMSQKWHGGLSHDHDLDGVQKVHTTAVPRIGGLGVIVGILLGCIAFRNLHQVGSTFTIGADM